MPPAQFGQEMFCVVLCSMLQDVTHTYTVCQRQEASDQTFEGVLTDGAGLLLTLVSVMSAMLCSLCIHNTSQS